MRLEPGFVYFAESDGPIKIGYAADPVRRVLQLRIGNPHGIHLLAKFPAFPEEEKELHRRFAHALIVGEWFVPIPEIVEIIKAYWCFTYEDGERDFAQVDGGTVTRWRV